MIVAFVILAGAAGIALVIGVGPERREPVTPAAWAFDDNCIDGGGFQNVIAADPHHEGSLLVGGDVSGFHRSSDGGDRWITSNGNLFSGADLVVNDIAFSPTREDVLYAATGTRRSGGGFLASLDGGRTWVPRSRAVTFGDDIEHPRATGNLIALERVGGTEYIYAGADQGIARSTDGGRSWTRLGLEGSVIRGLAIDPARPGSLYVGTGDGAYRIDDARDGAAVEKLPEAPAAVEEFAVVGDGVYAAAGTDGIFRVLAGGATWARLGGTFFPRGSTWSAITGYVDRGGGHALLTGAVDPQPDARGNLRTIARSLDGGTTWRWLTPARAVSHDVAGNGGTWWLSDSAAGGFMLGGRFFDVGQIVVDPSAPENIWVAGRSGVWRSSDGGARWAPAVDGLAVTLAW
ncbi:MAG: WD40/YVTN/BNR-like repeat-containing protein, partial [Actinomycetota bacterium]